MRKESRRTSKMIHFKVFLHKEGYLNDDAKGNVVLLDEHDKMTFGKAGNIPFNHWDEIPKAMRRLVARCLGLRKTWQGTYWRFEPSSRTTR